jgi:hypothetical protein
VSSLDDLYAASLDDFTAERDALAAKLRADGDREAADEVKRLRKPSVPAWAVNQVARRSAKRMAALIKAGEALQEAQRSLAGRGGRERLREAQSRERELVRDLTRDAEAALSDAGRSMSAAVQEQVEQTLHAAALDPELGEQVAAGRLEKPGVAVGFPGAAPAAAPADRAGGRSAAEERKRSGIEKRLLREQERLAEAGRRREEADAELKEAERAAKAAAKELDRAARRARAEERAETELAEKVEALRDEFDAAS